MKFATVINCIDGRTHIPIIKWVRESYDIDYVDMITEPGPDKVLSENTATFTIESIKKKISISIEKHGSKLLFISGHHDCAGNPVDETKHKEQILKSVKNIASWRLSIPVKGIWVDHRWQVSRIEHDNDSNT